MAGNKNILVFAFVSAIFFIFVISITTVMSLKSENTLLTGAAILGPSAPQNETAKSSFANITQFAVGVNALFSSQLKWFVLIVIAGIFIIGAAAAIFKPHFSPQSRTMQQKMWPVGFFKEQLKAYISSAMSSNEPKEKIWLTLRQKGWPPELIREAFKELNL